MSTQTYDPNFLPDNTDSLSIVFGREPYFIRASTNELTNLDHEITADAKTYTWAASECSPAPPHPEEDFFRGLFCREETYSAFDRWPFMACQNSGRSLRQEISSSLKERLEPALRKELDREERAYEKAFWSLLFQRSQSVDTYPLLQKHLERVDQIERSITMSVVNRLTSEELLSLKSDGDPARSGFNSMQEQVVRRIHRATLRFLDATSFPREHNRT